MIDAREERMALRKKIGFISLMTILLVSITYAQDFNQYEKLKNPQISSKGDQKMLVVEAKGDPNVAGKEAYATLFRIFFSLPEVRMAPPRARFPNISQTSKEEWIGLYALPLPDSLSSLPAGTEGARIDIWEYGEVAEILHIGAYSEETPAIDKLIKFITDNGYHIAGPHEEEYLRGPESGSDSSQYMTIIRYPVEKNWVRLH